MGTTPKGKGFNGLSVLQWNGRGSPNIPYLIDFLKTHPFDVLCLQSLGNIDRAPPVIPGFYYPPYYRKDPANFKTQVATYVKNGIVSAPCTAPDIQLSDSEVKTRFFCISIEIGKVFGQNSLKVTNCYFPEPNNIDWDWVSSSSVNTEQSHLICGDFNVNDMQWCKNGYFRPTKLGEVISDSSFCLLNTGACTRLPDRFEQRSTAPDLTLISQNIALSTHWEVYDDSLGSDHLPIQIYIQAQMAEAEQEGSKYCYEKADWNGFMQYLDSHLEELPDVEEEEFVSAFSCLITQAASAAIPIVKSVDRKVTNPWWNAECHKAVRNKKHLYNVWRKHRSLDNFDAWKQANIAANRTVAKAKIQHFEGKIKEELNDPTQLWKAWRLVKKMKGNYRPPDTGLIIDNKVIVDAEEKAEAFATAFMKVYDQNTSTHDSWTTVDSSTEGSGSTTSGDTSGNISGNTNSSSTYIKEFSVHEVSEIIKNLPTKRTALGPDGISYIMIKHLTPDVIKVFTKYLNVCYGQGRFPEEWKRSHVVPIPKPGKSRRCADNYRPISLTCHLSKVFEKLLKKRLEYHLERNKVIPNVQSGFRRHRSTTDQLVALNSYIKTSLRKRRLCAGAFFDIKKAFDTVNHSLLMKKLDEVYVPSELVDILGSFCAHRRFQVKVRNSFSSVKTVHSGVPQGTVLAPTLFNVMLYDLPEKVLAEEKSSLNLKMRVPQVFQFADDLALTMELENRRTGGEEERFQRVLDKVDEYLKDNGFHLSKQKCQIILFRLSTMRKSYHFSIGNEPVSFSPEVVYLGVTFQYQLSWRSHIQKMKVSATKGLNLIRSILKCPWAQDVSLLLTLHQAYVRSRLVYGQEVYFAARDKDLHSLSVIELRSLRVILGVGPGSSNDAVYKAANLIPLPQLRQLQCAQYINRAFQTDNNAKAAILSRNAHFGFKRDPKLQTIEDYVQPLFVQAEVEYGKVATIPPPMKTWQDSQVKVTYPDLQQKKMENPHHSKLVTLEMMEQKFENYFKLFTDGSCENDQAACGIYDPQERLYIPYRLSRGLSIYTAEMAGILCALKYMFTVNLSDCRVMIGVDSKSALLSLQNNKSCRPDLLQNILQFLVLLKEKRKLYIEFAWVPSHVGIQGNDMADLAAREGIREKNNVLLLVPSAAEMNNLLKRTMKQELEQDHQSLADVKKNVPIFRTKLTPKNFKGFSRNSSSLIFRLLTNSWKYKYIKQNCPCGASFSSQHALFDCFHWKQEIPQMHEFFTATATKTMDDIFGNSPRMFMELASIILHSDLGNWI